MIRYLIMGWFLLASLACELALGQPTDASAPPPFEITRVEVNGKMVPMDPGGSIVLPSRVDTFHLVFAPNPLAANPPIRFAWRLDGVQSGWQLAGGVDMRMIVRFRNNANEVLAERSFPVHGQTPGWTGRFSNTTFISRKETVTVPPGATRYWVVISSAGPPEAVGVYVIRDLFVSQPTITTNRISMIPPLAPDTPDAPPGHSPAPEGWIRDGLRLSDAQVVRYGAGGKVALAILDEGVDGHADWATLKEANSAIVAGAPLVLEWQEAYSIGRGDYGSPTYQDVAPGLYQFRMAGFTVMGLPTGTEDSVLVSVPVPLWATPFFWSMVLLAGLGFAVAGWRVIDWRRMMQQVKLMEQDRAIEVERVRIARDIHDDLGARVTQISLLSSAAEKRDGLTEQARQDFEQVSELSRSMVTALYETVWAVDPENDHLDELGAYICQMATQMCAQVKLKCRLMVPDLPQDVPLGSRIRHEIIMVIKEAIHNVIKHSGASELQIRILFENGLLSITLSDNGSGFDPAEQRLGNGLSNMKRRMESCQGTCSLQSRPGSGTHIRLQLPLLDGRTAQPRFGSKTPNGSKK